MPPTRVPDDVARVLDVFRQLGEAARRALWISERRAAAEVREAARRAAALLETVRARAPPWRPARKD